MLSVVDDCIRLFSEFSTPIRGEGICCSLLVVGVCLELFDDALLLNCGTSQSSVPPFFAWNVVGSISSDKVCVRTLQLSVPPPSAGEVRWGAIARSKYSKTPSIFSNISLFQILITLKPYDFRSSSRFLSYSIL